MKTNILTLFLSFVGFIGFGQLSKFDSVKNEIAKAKYDTTRINLYAQNASFASTLSNPQKIELAQKGYDLSMKIRYDKGSIACGQNLGFLLIEKDFTKALPILFETKRIAEKLKDTVSIVRSLGYIAYAYNKFDTKKSLYHYRLCLSLMQKAHISESVMPIYTVMGYGFKDDGQLDSALIYLKKGYESSLKGISPISVTSYDAKFGEIYYKKGNFSLAKKYLQQSISYKDENFAGEAYYYLAKIYQDQHMLDSAKYFAKKSLVYAQENERSIYLIQSSQLLFDLYKDSDPKAALKYLELSSATKDSLFNQEKARQVERMTFEEQEREQSIQRRIEAHNRDFTNKIQIYILLGVLLGLGLFAFSLYRNNKQKHKANVLLQDKNQQIEKTLSQLKATQTQLIQSEKLASLGELTAGIAHEIQNPLNFVNNFSELSIDLAQELKEEIEKSPLTPDGGIIIVPENKEYIDEIISDLTQNQQKINLHGKRASSIVKGMLQHSRTSSGEKELTDINALTDEYLRLSYHGLRAKDKNFNSDYKTDFDGNLPKIEVIPQDLGRVLLNLFNNAFYAVNVRQVSNLSESVKPLVIVSTERADNQIIIKVKDNGTGMSEATKAKIFQPFFTTKPTGEGTGLGLSLSYDIITKGHSGTLEVESVEGEGSTFIVKLPI